MDRSDPMTEFFDAHRPATAFDHDSTLVVAMELSGKSWQLGAVVPGVSRRPRRGLKVGDTDELLRALLAWLRGEPRVCAMVRVPSEEEEDARRPGRERHKLTRERVSIENQIQSLLWLHGIYGFRPRLKKAKEKLEALRMRSGASLPRETMAQLRRLMIRQRLLGEQLAEIDAAREAELAAAAKAPDPERGQRMIRLLVAICGVGLETATQLVREVLCRPFRDRRAVAAFVGLTGTPFRSGGMEREQGVSKSGDKRVRGLMMQLAWRWLKFQSDSALSRWYVERVGDAKGRIRKIMAVALARKLLVALWRYVQDGVIPEGARLAVFRGGRVAAPGYGCKTPPSRLVPSPRSLAIALRAFGLLVGSVFGSPGYELAGLWSAPTKGRLG